MEKRSIVIDDDKMVRMFLTDYLKSRGYSVITCESPIFCSILLNRTCDCPSGLSCADVIITDIRMPGMSGLDFVENQMKNKCRVPGVAIMSGNWSADDRERARGLDVLILEKPFTISGLSKWLDEVEKKIDPKRILRELPDKAI